MCIGRQLLEAELVAAWLAGGAETDLVRRDDAEAGAGQRLDGGFPGGAAEVLAMQQHGGAAIGRAAGRHIHVGHLQRLLLRSEAEALLGMGVGEAFELRAVAGLGGGPGGSAGGVDAVRCGGWRCLVGVGDRCGGRHCQSGGGSQGGEAERHGGSAAAQRQREATRQHQKVLHEERGGREVQGTRQGHREPTVHSIGRNCFQTLSSITGWALASGWMRSAWNQSAASVRSATPASRKGTSGTFSSCATVLKPASNSRV